MSETINNQQNQNDIPDHENSLGSESPLPDFNIGPEDEEMPESPLKISVANPSDLDNFLAAQRSADTWVEKKDMTMADEPYDTPINPDLPDYGSSTPLNEVREEKSSTWKTAWSIIREVGETVLLTLIIFLIIQMFVRNFRVVGTSMVNNLQNGQYLIIDKISYNQFLMEYSDIGGPARGDVIVFKPPRYPSEDYVKRVVGLPGEKVQVIKGQVYINDELLAEPFNPVQGSYSMPAPITVPEGQVFVLGDNRNNSNDSHNWGPLPIENIVGRAWISYWPPDLWGTIPRDIPTEQATLKHYLGRFIPSANAKSE